jgi:molecular chaperone DnaK (HSP70)
LARIVHALIPKHAVLPQSHSATFTTSKDDQTKAMVSVVVGESHRGEENLCVGQLVLRDLPKRTKGALVVRVTVDIDVEGDISVTA